MADYTFVRVRRPGVEPVVLRTDKPWDVVLDRLTRDDPRKIGGPKLPKQETTRGK